jgi:hypothetical protein
VSEAEVTLSFAAPVSNEAPTSGRQELSHLEPTTQSSAEPDDFTFDDMAAIDVTAPIPYSSAEAPPNIPIAQGIIHNGNSQPLSAVKLIPAAPKNIFKRKHKINRRTPRVAPESTSLPTAPVSHSDIHNFKDTQAAVLKHRRNLKQDLKHRWSQAKKDIKKEAVVLGKEFKHAMEDQAIEAILNAAKNAIPGYKEA